jgi:hypothetical protein
MKRQALITVAVAAILAEFIIGYQGTGFAGTDAPFGASVRIVHISPPTSSVVRVGDRLSVLVEAEYSLTTDSGIVSLIVQGSDIFPIAQGTQVVT